MINVFITSTEQNESKKFVIAGLSGLMQSLGYSVGVYKPIITNTIEVKGFLQSKDLMFVKYIDPFVKTYFSYMFKNNLTPLFAAAQEKTEIEKDIIISDFQKIQKQNEILLTSGTFGLATPLNKNLLEEDIIKELDIPVLLVISAQKSTINNIILSINRLKEQNIELNGVIITDFEKQIINEKTLLPQIIEEYTDAKVLGTLPVIDLSISPSDLITQILNNINIENVFNIKIAKLNN